MTAKHGLLRRIALVAAVAAILVPSAQAARGYPQVRPQAQPDLVQPRSESDSSWGDTRVGGGVVLTVMLLGFALVLTRYSRRSRRPAAS